MFKYVLIALTLVFAGLFGFLALTTPEIIQSEVTKDIGAVDKNPQTP
jgi:hypothetical protein